MRPLFLRLSLIALLIAPLHAFGGTTATMQVSFIVLASCTVDMHGVAAPAVDCVQPGSYLVTPRAPSSPAAAAGTGTGTGTGAGADINAAAWTVFF